MRIRRHFVLLTPLAIASVAVLAATAGSVAQAVSVNPSGVNVRSNGATTVFLTFQALAGTQQLEEALWCGAINGDSSCVAGTIFGRLPARSNLARASGGNNVTDIMTIPASVVRRAVQDARSGSQGDFFYVRRFSDTGGGGDEFVAVTCRLGGGGARTPLALIDVAMRFEIDEPVLFVPRGSPPSPFVAEIRYNGSGRFKGRWEIVLPGDPQPTIEDLLTEATLPVENRGTQRRYTVLERFDQFLPPNGRLVLKGPDPSKLPHGSDGLHLILLRVEATDGRESRSNTGAVNVQTGGVAGFPMPVLRYYVGSGENAVKIASSVASERLTLIAPRDGSRLAAAALLNFSWNSAKDVSVYQVEIAGEETSVLTALVDGTVTSYTAPPWIRLRAGEVLQWRIVGFGTSGKPKFRSEWRSFHINQ